MKIVLELLDQSSSVRKITVRHDIVIGRGSDCNLRLSAPQVSRRHCFLRVSREGVSVTDLDSSNGTWVNGDRIPSGVRSELADGCLLSLGPVRFLIHIRPEAVNGNVLPTTQLNEFIADQATASGGTTTDNRHRPQPNPPPDPLTSSIAARQTAPNDAPDSQLEIIELGRQLAAGTSPHDAVILTPPHSELDAAANRPDNARTAHDIDLREISSLDSVDVLDPAVLSGRFPPDRSMWSRKAGQELSSADSSLPPTLQLNPPNTSPDHDDAPPDLAAAADELNPEELTASFDSVTPAPQSADPQVPSTEDSRDDNDDNDDNDDMGPELQAFLKGL